MQIAVPYLIAVHNRPDFLKFQPTGYKRFLEDRLSYIFLPLTAIGMSACSSGKEEVKRPNIIFMMTDDHTTQAMSCYGGRFPSDSQHG